MGRRFLAIRIYTMCSYIVISDTAYSWAPQRAMVSLILLVWGLIIDWEGCCQPWLDRAVQILTKKDIWAGCLQYRAGTCKKWLITTDHNFSPHYLRTEAISVAITRPSAGQAPLKYLWNDVAQATQNQNVARKVRVVLWHDSTGIPHGFLSQAAHLCPAPYLWSSLRLH